MRNPVIIIIILTLHNGIVWQIHVSTDVKVAQSYVQTCLLKLVSHIWVSPISSRTAWHIQIWASLQLVQIQDFVNHPMSIKEMEKPAASHLLLTRLALLFLEIQCLVKMFSRSILPWKLQSIHHVVVFEEVSSLIIVQFF